MDNPIISIGIPAYNEAVNIKKLLLSLLSQKIGNFEIAEIIVVSDGSNDNTVAEVGSVQNTKIKIIDRSERKGKAKTQNEIISLFAGDILVMLDADILPKNNDFLLNLVQPFFDNHKLSLTSSKGMTLTAETWFEKIINYSVQLKDSMTESLNGGDNIYNCHGFARAMSRDFAKQVSWPFSIGEDAYLYLLSKKLKLNFFYAFNSVALYRSPQNFSDHIKQTRRFAESMELMKKHFYYMDVAGFYNIPKIIFYSNVTKYFFKNPVLFTGYLIVQFSAKLNKTKLNTNYWEPSATSKSLIK